MGRRPLKYQTPEEMQKAVNEYFNSCYAEKWVKNKDGTWTQVLDHNGNPVMEMIHHPTITGLSLALGFHSRHPLLDYGQRDEFAGVVARAKLRVENGYEQGTVDGNINPPAGIFGLKQFDWRDQQTIQMSNAPEVLSVDEVKKRLKAANGEIEKTHTTIKRKRGRPKKTKKSSKSK